MSCPSATFRAKGAEGMGYGLSECLGATWAAKFRHGSSSVRGAACENHGLKVLEKWSGERSLPVAAVFRWHGGRAEQWCSLQARLALLGEGDGQL